MSAAPDFWPMFKPIRNWLRRFSVDSIIETATAKLHEVQGFKRPEALTYRPWDLLLLIKWSILYGDSCASRRFDGNALLDAIRRMQVFDKPGADLISSRDQFLFLKNMAQKQFWLQRVPDIAFVARQRVLFLSLPNSGALAQQLHSAFGIDPVDFFEIGTMLLSYFGVGKARVVLDISYFDGLKDRFSGSTLDAYFKLVSPDRNELRAFLVAQDQRVKSFEAKLNEQSPLRMKPLLRTLPRRHLCYSPDVLNWAISTLPYDALKRHDPAGFSQVFGSVFESYVDHLLGDSKLPYSNERQLKTKLGPSSKVVDFLIEVGDTRILIECKAIELSPLAAVTPERDVVNSHLRDSVIKAIKQVLSTRARLILSSSTQSEAVFLKVVVV